MPASPSSSRPPHAPANPPAHDPWVHAVEHDVPLLHPKARSDAGDDEEEPGTKETTDELDRKAMPVNADKAQPPPTLPKNGVSSPPKSDNVGADPRLPIPPRAHMHIRGPSSPPVPTPFSPSKSQVNNPLPHRDRQTGAGTIGSTAGGYVADLASQQSSSSSTTATATATQGGAAHRNPRSSFFRSSPLAASTSSSSGMVAKNLHYFPTSASTSTTGLIASFPSPGSSPLPNSSSTSTSTSSPATLLNSSPPMSTPNSMAPSSSSSLIHQGPGQGARTGQRQRTFSEANSALSGSSSSVSPPIPTNAPYPNSQPYPHPNPTSIPSQQQQQQQQQPFARQGSRGGLPPSSAPTSYPNSPNPNYGHAHRGPSEDSRGFESGQSTPHAYSHAGFMGGSSNGNGGAGMGPGPGVGLRDPGIPHSHSRGSMILYRLSATEDGILPPPGMPVGRRASMYSNSGDSIASLGGDSKYPLVGLPPYGAGSGTRTPGTPGRPGTPGTPASGSIGNRGGEHSLAEIGRVQGGLVAYVYDPDEDLDADELDEEEEEWVRNVGGHVGFGSVTGKGDIKSLGSMGKGSLVKGKSQRSTLAKIPPMPNGKGGNGKMQSRVPMTIPTPPTKSTGVSLRGLVNVGTLVILIIGLLLLFLLYPIFSAYNNNGVEQLIIGNTRINSTGQAALELIAEAGDKDKREWTWSGFDKDLP